MFRRNRAPMMVIEHTVEAGDVVKRYKLTIPSDIDPDHLDELLVVLGIIERTTTMGTPTFFDVDEPKYL